MRHIIKLCRQGPPRIDRILNPPDPTQASTNVTVWRTTDLCFINKAQSFDKHEGRSKAAVAEWEFAPTKLWKILSKKSSMCKLWCSVSKCQILPNLAKMAVRGSHVEHFCQALPRLGSLCKRRAPLLWALSAASRTCDVDWTARQGDHFRILACVLLLSRLVALRSGGFQAASFCASVPWRCFSGCSPVAGASPLPRIWRQRRRPWTWRLIPSTERLPRPLPLARRHETAA